MLYHEVIPTTYVERNRKLFYVNYTRTKDILVVYYPAATDSIVKGMKVLFGEFNVYSI